MLKSFVVSILAFSALFVVTCTSLEIVRRNEWEAKPPKEMQYLNRAVPLAIIHHSHSPPMCNTTEECKRAMRSMQDFHQNGRGWADIGYNFAIGGDGKVYEGRGFNLIGAHALSYNSKSIGICLIGDWQETVPPANMLSAAQDLIAMAVDGGFLSKNYGLLGHRQVRDTTCPGPALFNEIKQWPHFRENPNAIEKNTI